MEVKRSLLRTIYISTLFAVALFGSIAVAASTGTIDPNNTGAYKAAFLDTGVVTDPSINFGKFTTESQYNITVSDTELRGYAWGSSVGYIVMNCADTTSGCSSTNGNFKVANDGNGNLSGYAWGDNTGWINFGPFTDTSVSTVKIGTDGNFGGTSGSAGYAWSQNYGWIIFDCTNANTCVNTSWRATVAPAGGNTGGASGTSGGTSGGGGGAATGSTPGTGQSPSGTNTSTPPSTTTSTTPPGHPGSNSSSSNGNGNGAGAGAAGSTSDQPGGGPGDNGTTPSGPSQPPLGAVSEPQNNPAQTTSEKGLFSNGLSLPPAFNEVVTNMVAITTQAVVATRQTLVEGATAVLQAAQTKAGIATNRVATTVGFLTTVLAGLAALAFANPFAIGELFLLPFRFWNFLMILFGFKKRVHPWGTVYDSVTKQPIDPAYVVLMDMQDNEVATSITDIDGRYGFSVPAGTYKMLVNKTNFVFPSVKLANKHADELYNELYFGETIVVKEEGEVIAKNVPMDQLNFDWNEFAKNEQKRLSYYHKSDLLIARLSSFFFWFGFVVAAISVLAADTTYNTIVFILYVVLFLVRQYSPQFKSKGSVTDTITEQPLPFDIVHVLSAATGQEITHKVADRLGNYYCLLPNGQYKIVIDRKNADATYTKIPVLEPITVKKGYLNKDFAV